MGRPVLGGWVDVGWGEKKKAVCMRYCALWASGLGGGEASGLNALLWTLYGWVGGWVAD